MWFSGASGWNFDRAKAPIALVPRAASQQGAWIGSMLAIGTTIGTTIALSMPIYRCACQLCWLP